MFFLHITFLIQQIAGFHSDTSIKARDVAQKFRRFRSLAGISTSPFFNLQSKTFTQDFRQPSSVACFAFNNILKA